MNFRIFLTEKGSFLDISTWFTLSKVSLILQLYAEKKGKKTYIFSLNNTKILCLPLFPVVFFKDVLLCLVSLLCLCVSSLCNVMQMKRDST